MDPFTPQHVFAEGDRLNASGARSQAVGAWLRAFTGDTAFSEPLRERLHGAYLAMWSNLPRDPDLSFDDYIALARLHSAADRHGMALGLLAKAGALAPGSGDLHLCMGEAYFLQAFENTDPKPMFDQAIDHLSVAVLMGIPSPTPDRISELYYLVGASHFFREEHQDAMENLGAAVELNPGKAEAHFFLGLASRRLGQFEDAASHLERATAVAPDAYNLQQLGLCYAELGRYEEAIARLREAMVIRPDLVDLHRDLGVALIQQAEIDFDRSVTESLGSGEGPETLSLSSFIERADVQEAMAELKRFMDGAKAMPGKATREKVRLMRGAARGALPTDRMEDSAPRKKPTGFAFVGFGGEGPRMTVKDDLVRDPLQADVQAARDRFELFQGAGERSSKDCSDLGLTWLRRKLYGAALVAFEEALRKDSKLAEVHQYAAVAWSQIGEDERSAHASEQALRLGAKQPEPHRDLGLFYLARSAEALPALPEGVLDEDVGRTLALLRAARLGAERDKAIEHLRKYVERSPDDEISGFLSQLISTYEGNDTTLQNVLHLAVNQALLRGAYLLGERLLEDLEPLVGKEQKESIRDRLEEVRRLGRTEARIRHERANILMATGQSAKAVEEYRAALELDPALEKAHYNLGLALYEDGDTAGALEHLQRFLDLRAGQKSKLIEFAETSPGALESRLQWGDAAKKLERVEQEASVLLVKLQMFR